jgi:hypothetical protein
MSSGTSWKKRSDAVIAPGNRRRENGEPCGSPFCRQTTATGWPVSMDRMIASNAAMVLTISAGVMG